MTREAVTLKIFCCMPRGQTGIGFDGVYETQVGERQPFILLFLYVGAICAVN